MFLPPPVRTGLYLRHSQPCPNYKSCNIPAGLSLPTRAFWPQLAEQLKMSSRACARACARGIFLLVAIPPMGHSEQA